MWNGWTGRALSLSKSIVEKDQKQARDIRDALYTDCRK